MKLYYILFVLLVIAGIGCKKEYEDKYRLVPGDTTYISGNASILAFQVNEFSKDTALQAVITHDSIVLYWPWYRDMPDSVHPVITLPARASIAPISGEAIAAKDGQIYTVTAESGAVSSYKLYIDHRQPKPIMGVTTDAQQLIGNSLQLFGTWIIPDTVHSKVILESLDGKQVYNAVMLSASTVDIKAVFRSDIPPGIYNVNVVSGAYTLPHVMERMELQANEFPWIFDYGQDYHAKPGATIVLDGTYLSGVISIVVLVDGATLETVPVTDFKILNDNTIAIKLPDDLRPGSYEGIDVFTTPDGFNGPGATNGRRLIVEPK